LGQEHDSTGMCREFFLSAHLIFSFLLLMLAVTFGFFEHTEALEWFAYVGGGAAAGALFFACAFARRGCSFSRRTCALVSGASSVAYGAFLAWTWWPRAWRFEFILLHVIVAVFAVLILVPRLPFGRTLREANETVTIAPSSFRFVPTHILGALAALSLFCGDIDPFVPYLSLLEATMGGLLALAGVRVWRVLPHRRRMALAVAGAVLAAAVFIPAQLPADYFHYAAYTGPVFDLLHGKDASTDIPTLYGLLVMQLLTLPFRFFDIVPDVSGLLWINSILFVLSFVLAAILFRSLFPRSPAAWVYTAAFILAYVIDSPEEPQTGPLRFILPLFITLAFVFLRGWRLWAAGSVLAAVSLLWSSDVAIVCIPAWLFALALPVFSRHGMAWRGATIIMKQSLLAATACVLVAALIAVLLDPKIFVTAFMRITAAVSPADSEWSAQLSEPYGTFFLAVPLLFFGMAQVIWLAVNGRTSAKLTALGFLALANLAGFSYCVYIGGAGFLHLFPGLYIMQWAFMVAVAAEEFGVSIRVSHSRLRVAGAVVAVYFAAGMAGQTVDMAGRYRDGSVWQTVRASGPPFLSNLAREFRLSPDRIGIISFAGSRLCSESDIANLFPFNPLWQTTYMRNWRKEYLEPAVSRLKPGDIIVYQRDMLGRELFMDAFVSRWRLELLTRRTYDFVLTATTGSTIQKTLLDIYRVAEAWMPDNNAEAYRDAIRRSPGFFEAYERLDALLPGLEARSNEWRQFRQAFPQEALPAYFLGRALHEAGKIPEAVEALRAAVAADPHYPEVWEELARACESAALWQEAIDAYRHVAVYELFDKARPAAAILAIQLRMGDKAAAWATALAMWKEEYMLLPSMNFLNETRPAVGRDSFCSRFHDAWWYGKRLPN